MSSPLSIETTGESIEQAIAKGLAELKVEPSQVIVEVLEEPSESMFGLPGRLARVRLQVMNVPSAAPVYIPPPPADEPLIIPQPPPMPEPPPERPPREARRERPERRSEEHAGSERRERRSSGERPERGERRERSSSRPPKAPSTELPDYMLDVDDEDIPVLAHGDEVPEAELDDEASIGRVVLNELLTHMDVRGQVIVRRADAGDQGETTPWVLDIVGGNLNRLVGRRGETLAALQYITRLITSRELQRRSEIIVDVEGYKARRAASLHALALRMADESVRTNRVIPLEPMPPHERRIIHLALRGRQDVVTKSIGEGVTRKVTIVPSSLA